MLRNALRTLHSFEDGARLEGSVLLVDLFQEQRFRNLYFRYLILFTELEKLHAYTAFAGTAIAAVHSLQLHGFTRMETPVEFTVALRQLYWSLQVVSILYLSDALCICIVVSLFKLPGAREWKGSGMVKYTRWLFLVYSKQLRILRIYENYAEPGIMS